MADYGIPGGPAPTPITDFLGRLAGSASQVVSQFQAVKDATAIYNSVSSTPVSDLRARLRPKPGGVDLLYGTPSNVLRATGGMVWPYTPTITYSQDVLYDAMNPVHTNQEILSYTRTPASKLSISGVFTSQTTDEALYNLGCIHFLRTVTKMSFGSSKTPPPGTPPPVLLFDAHGPAMFNSLPVVVTQFSVTIPSEPDYISVVVPTTTQYTRLPVLFEITVALTVQNTPKALRDWSLDKFRQGSYLRPGGWI